jgi:hypothetical protein
LSGLVWAAEDYFEILGTSFAIRSDELTHRELVRKLLAPFLLDRPTGVRSRNQYGLASTDRGVLAYHDCRRMGAPSAVETALIRLIAALNRSAIGQYSGFAVHAGVVATGGLAVALPVDSGGGKSTLTAACLRVGFDYVSDESLCVDPVDGSIKAYPKPIALSRTSTQLLAIGRGLTVPVTGPEGLLTAADLGATVVEGPLRLAHLVVPTFGSDELVLEERPASEAMATLLRLSFNHYKLGEQAFHLAAHLSGELRAWTLKYDDPISAAELLKLRLT